MTGAVAPNAAEWRGRARRFVDQYVAPRVEEIDRTDHLPVEIIRALADAGFMGLNLPPEYGGAGGSTETIAAVLEELARGSAAVATLLAVHLSVASAPILERGNDDQRRRYLPRMASGEWLGAFALTEPGVGSDSAHLSCRYFAENGGFRLNGTKTFITNAAIAQVLLVFATRDPREGHRGISAFIVAPPTAGFRVAQHFDKLGLRGSETNELVLEDVRVAGGELLGAEGEGLRIALGALTGGRVGIAACALGVARAALEEMQRAVREDPADWKRAALARAYGQVHSAAALVQEAARLKDSGVPYVEAASAAKLVASQAAVDVSQRTLDVVGWPGARSGAVAERLFRDARVFPIVEGTTEVQEFILGRSLGESTRPTS